MAGEWAQEPGFALVDIGQVALAASIGVFARARLQDEMEHATSKIRRALRVD